MHREYRIHQWALGAHPSRPEELFGSEAAWVRRFKMGGERVDDQMTAEKILSIVSKRIHDTNMYTPLD
jgi:hypothetical protein